ncbi:unnamed protein product, partial [Brassica rapa subsp. trilocularis]
MSLSSMIVRKGGPSTVRRKLDSEDEIIRIPDCDLDAVADRFRLTLIGRVFNLQGRSIDALIHLLPRNRIWNVEGRVRGINLGNGRFQFDFDNEADLLSVLNKRPCHFNQWSFALERWEPLTSESFPNTIPFWISVTGVPVHFWNDQTFIAISKPLGTWVSLDSKRARIQVSVNVDMPIQFERRIEFPNGDIGRVSFSYEGLHRSCYTCHMISHDENVCPQLTPEERELKRQQRAIINAQGDTLSIQTGHDGRVPNLKRPRSPLHERNSPPPGRQRTSPSNLSERDYRREGKRHAHSPHRDTRAYRPSQKDYPRDNDNSYRNNTRKEDVWRRLEILPRASSAYGKLNSSRTSRRENPYPQKNRENKQPMPYNGRYSSNRQQATREWRPRSPPKIIPSTDMVPVSSRTPHMEQEGPSRAVSDSQRTISDQFGHLELGELRTEDQPKSPIAETDEERLRRIKGKGLITDTPTSREREPGRIRSSTLIIREPAIDTLDRQPIKTPHTAAPPPEHTDKNPNPQDMELDIDFDQELDITLTEEEIALVDSLAKDAELAEMDAEMMENDDLLDEIPDEAAEKIDAISQLSPTNVEDSTVMQEDLLAPTRAQTVTNPNRSKPYQAPPTLPSAKGYLKKHAPKSPD